MDYVAYLKETFDNVYRELNYNYSGSGTEYVVKYIGGGTNYLDSVIQPVQILAYTDDVKTTYNAMSAFAQSNSGLTFVQDNEYIKENYTTPVVLSSFGSGGANHYTNISLTATLIVSTNLSDIKTVTIDDVEYFTTSRKISYVTVEDTQAKGQDDRRGETDITKGILKFVVSMENKNNDLCTKARRIREGNLDINNSFTIKLTFTDNDYVESYTMKLSSMSFDSSNLLSPIITLTFTRW